MNCQLMMKQTLQRWDNSGKLSVIDENNFFKFKLTQKDRRLLKKEFGEKGYKRFLFYNSIGMFSVIVIIIMLYKG